MTYQPEVMTNEEIIYAIRQMTGLTDIEAGLLLQSFESKNIRKKTSLLKAGKTAKEIYFIVEGCLRLFYEKDGEDISAYFFTEGMFAGAYDSFITQKASRHSIETLEECQVLSISYLAFQDMFVTFPRMNEFVRRVLEERFVALHELFTAQILDSPEERYINLQKNRPDLINRIPQHQIATFLGITPVSLSRIRNRLAKK
jgi:CRP-like cAMP-binding protein